MYSMSKEFWHAYSTNRMAVFAVITILFIGLLALAGPYISPYDPFDTRAGAPFLSPNPEHPMGTDNLGRDVFSGVLFAVGTSLIVSFLAAATSTIIGLLVGATSGYFAGGCDTILMRITDIFQVVPRFFLALIVVAIFGRTIFNIILVIGVLSWPPTSRLVRAEVLSLRERSFVEASKAIGESTARLVFAEILPNVMPVVIVSASLQVGQAILLEAGLGFLGLSDPLTMSLGRMLENAQMFIRLAWWLWLFPGVMIFLIVLGLNAIGDGLSDALSPRYKGLQR